MSVGASGGPAGPVRALLSLAGARRLLLLAGLMVLVAASEWIGIVLLVPLLAALGSEPAPAAGLLGGLLARSPVPVTLGPLLAAFVTLVTIRSWLQLTRQLAAARLERRVVEGLRRRAVAALLHADWRALAARPHGEHLSLLVGGVDRIGYALSELVGLAAATLLLGAAFLAALALSPMVAAGALAGAALALGAYALARRRSLRLGQELVADYARLNARLGETIGALRLVKSFAAERRSAGELAAIDRSLTGNRIEFQRFGGLAQGLLQVAGAAVLAVIVWMSVERWGVSPLLLLPLIALFARALPLLAAVQQHWHSWLHARPALDEVLRVVAALEDSAEPPAGGEVVRPARAIALAGISLRHPGRAEPVLEGIDLVLPVATTTALVGPSGAGKSTLADVLGGLLAPDAGTLLLDGRALGEVERIAWRGHVAYVQQEPVLFHATVRENLLWAVPEASEARIAAALRDASAEFVHALPQGLDTEVGDAGRRLSGGERQRLVLARALLRDPALLILDEPTSALDPANEAAIAAAVARMRGRLTLLIIGHRGPLAENADQLVRLEAGRIVARRTAAEAA